jgi:hypothetical protein
MPALPGMELGPPPPGAPRALPKGFAFRTRWSGNIASLLGAVLFGFGTATATPMVITGHWLPALFPAFFALGGFSLLRYGLNHASGILRAFRHGVATTGKVASIGLDPTQSLNGKHPWKLIYHFPVNGQLTEGKLVSFDSTLAHRRIGQPVWVLYREQDPNQNTLFPPVK